MKLSFLIIIVILSFHFVSAQPSDRPNDQIEVVPESGFDIAKDTTGIATKDKSSSGGFFRLFTGKPGKAALYSLIVPGGGQFYNRDYWKIPLVWGAEGAAIYYIVDNRKNYIIFRDGYADMLAGNEDDVMGVTDESDVRTIRDAYRKNVEVSWVVLVAFHLLNVFEAFIDRHLMNFDINENLGFQNESLGLPSYTLGSISIPLYTSKKRNPKWVNP